MGEISIIDHRRLISIAPLRVPWPSRRVFDNRYLEPDFQELSQMGLDAHVCEDSTEDDLADTLLAKLQHHIIGLRSEDLVRAADDRLPILDIRLEALKPVCSR